MAEKKKLIDAFGGVLPQHWEGFHNKACHTEPWNGGKCKACISLFNNPQAFPGQVSAATGTS